MRCGPECEGLEDSKAQPPDKFKLALSSDSCKSMGL